MSHTYMTLEMYDYMLQTLPEAAFLVSEERVVSHNDDMKMLIEELHEQGIQDLESYIVTSEETLSSYRVVLPNEVTLVISRKTVVLGDGNVTLYLVNKDQPYELKKAIRENPLLTQMFKKHKAAMLLLDPETGDIVAANDAAVAFYGYKRDTLEAMKVHDINVMTEDSIYRTMKEVKESEGNVFVFSHKLADGSIKKVETASRPIDYGGKRYLFSILHDVTEREAYSHELTKRNEELKQETELFEKGPVVVIEWENAPGWPVNYVSPNIEDLLGVPSHAFKTGNKTFGTFIFEEDLDRVLKEVDQYVSEGRTHYKQSYRLQKQDETIIWIEDYTVIEYDENGDVISYHGYLLDVTEKRELQQEMQRVQNSLNEAQKIANLGHYDIHLESGTLWLSDEHYQLLKLTPGEDVTFNNYLDFVHPEDKPAFYEQIKDLYYNHIPFDMAFKVILRNGEVRHFHGKAEVLYDESGEPYRIIGINQDITEAIILKEQLQMFRFSVDHAPEAVY